MASFDYHGEAFTTMNAIRPPRVARVLGIGLVFCMAAVTLFLIYVPWVQTASGPGAVTALNPNDRMQEINALVSGRIQEWYVRDGSRVKVGDPILRIVDNDPQLLQRLRAEREQIMAKLSAAQTALDIAQIDKLRMQNLFDQGLSARREFEQARIRVQQLRADVAQAGAELSRVDVNLSRQSASRRRDPAGQRRRRGDLRQRRAGGGDLCARQRRARAGNLHRRARHCPGARRGAGAYSVRRLAGDSVERLALGGRWNL